MNEEKSKKSMSDDETKEGVNVIRIKSGQMKSYIEVAKKFLNVENGGSVRIVGDGNAIAKAISITEILKRQYPSISQQNSLNAGSSLPTSARRVTSCLTIDLTTTASHQQDD